MMLKKAITKSGRKILKAIKNVSASRLAKKQQHLQQTQSQRAEQQQQLAKFTHETRDYYNLENQKQHHLAVDSVNVYYMLSEDGQSLIPYERCYLCCCHCDERDENQRNENLENEMLRPEEDFVTCSTPTTFEFFDQPMIIEESHRSNNLLVDGVV
ncbi:hypothetical protein QAD02_019424 [Eretmocerus hayati]|uniref:Uncharacterized protein n=1 Tax=Eretmocerus hayati TaxID=131215 RepID=A0ACC2PJU8_9HYME|nr:hypothetical protein QAD02_019424 [Eretmocerus hayati]